MTRGLVVLGASYDYVRDANLVVEKVSPQLGLYVWPVSWLSVRAAAFQSVKPALVADQTIRPVQLLGFSVYADDLNGTLSQRYVAAADAHLGRDVFAGIGASRRTIDIPLDATGDPSFLNSKESAFSAYVGWTPRRDVALSAKWAYEESTRPETDVALSGLPWTVRNTVVPLSARYFSPGGFIAGVTATYVKQQVSSTLFLNNRANSEFALGDVFVGYRLPSRRGLISLSINNIFDKEFFFYDLNFLTTEPLNPRFIPARTILGRVSLYF
jgi:hypothetical protein